MDNKMRTKAESMQKLRNHVGWRAFNALIKGRPLLVWRCTSPHNWWVPASPKSECDHLWHSGDWSDVPDLQLFNVGIHSNRKVVEYWSADSGMSEQSMYFLKKDFIRAWKKKK